MVYAQLFGWRTERIDVGSASYFGLDLGNGIAGGVVERDVERALWLAYVEVADIVEATEHARTAAGEVALWRPKR